MNKNQGIGKLKLFLTILVVAHHAFLAYTPTGVGATIHDFNRTEIFSYITVIFDNFFMFTFFFIAGLFTLRSLKKRGVKNYISSRFKRLMIPFFIAAATINIIGLYIKDFQAGFTGATFFDYYQYVLINFFPTFHLWFLWVLFTFNLVAALIYKLFTTNATTKTFLKNIEFNKFISNTKNEISKKSPMNLFLIIFGLTLFIYSLSVLTFGLEFVYIFGPFQVQLGRVPAYFLMYVLGIIFGKDGLNETFLYSKDNKNVKQYKLLILTGLISSILLGFVLVNIENLQLYVLLENVGAVLTTLTLSSLTVGLVGIFVSKEQAKKEPSKIINSLIDNAFLIYIYHYAVVNIFQGYFYNINYLGVIEGLLVFIFSLFASYLLAVFTKKLVYKKR